MDALGARQYSDEKIRKFLSARSDLNATLDYQARQITNNFPRNVRPPKPVTFTFGDTLIIVCELRSKKNASTHIFMMLLLLQNYLFHSLEEGILFRGSYSIGTYIDDAKSNTVMGEAITDAASWYEKSNWFGLASTPRTNNILESCFYEESCIDNPLFALKYPVPMKDGREIELYTVSWPGRFFHDGATNPEKQFIDLIKELPIPFGTEIKHTNAKKYFHHVMQRLEAQTAAASANNTELLNG